MQIEFYKYQGTGNDFIIIDNREANIDPRDTSLISHLCERKYGIGADGLILLEKSETCDFSMRYFNSDGREASLCGNGSRCIVAFAHHLGIVSDQIHFTAIDGEHKAYIKNHHNTLWVSLKMQDVDEIEAGEDYCYLNTGSPHYVKFIDNPSNLDTYSQGRAIRYNERFAGEGTNVNFVTLNKENITVSTYERGVEDETLSCGTGVVASALSSCLKEDGTSGSYRIKTKGGELLVRYKRGKGNQFSDIWLEGPATLVFKGLINT